MPRVLLSGAGVLIRLAAPAAPILASAAAAPAAAAAAPSHPAAPASPPPTSPARPGLYHVPIIGKVVLPGLGSLLGGGLRRATNVQSANWSGYADTDDTYNSVASSWTVPTVNCANSGVGGLGGLLGGPGGLGGLFGGPSAASALWVGLDGYTSTSVEQIGTDSDCNAGTPSYYAWYEMYPNPSVVLPSQYVVHPGDRMTALVASNSSGTSAQLTIKDTTASWTFSTTRTGGSFARSSAEVIAEVPLSCTVLFCGELPLADFGQVGYSGSSLIDTAGTKGSLSSFNANQITMSSNGTTLATPSNLSSDGTAFLVTWNNS